jgi:LacI family transcriptional regulator
MAVTLADVARRAGVSLATASRVLNGSARAVSDEMRARVTAAARELHYVPNAHAQALARAATQTVGVIVHDVSDPYFGEILRGIQRSATDAGRLMIVCNTFRDPQRELEYVHLLQMQRVEAIILAGSGLDDRAYCRSLTERLDSFASMGGRVAVIGRHNIAADAVVPDNVGGARALAHYLLDLGHRSFGVIDGPALLTTSRDRRSGFVQALQANGITLPPEAIISGDFTRDGGAQGAINLLERFPSITAIFALNDVMAIGALAALRERGITVPDQISIVGFDDIPIAADVTPALTTMRVPMSQLGSEALALALSAEDTLRTIHLPTEMIVRQSTAPLSAT